MRARPWLLWKEKHTSAPSLNESSGTPRKRQSPRIKPIPSIMMDDNTTMTMGWLRADQRAMEAVFREVAPSSCCDACRPFVHAQPDASNVQDHAYRTFASSEQEVRAAIAAQEKWQECRFRRHSCGNPQSWWRQDGVPSLFSFSLYFRIKLQPSLVSRRSDVPTLEGQG